MHAHLLLPALQQAVGARDPEGFAAAQALEARRNGPESLAASGRMIGERMPLLTSLDARLAEMDRQGVDVQVVSPSPSHYYPWAGEELAAWAAREANRAIAEHVAGAPDRLLGLGLVPLQHPQLVVAALEDAVVERGLAGVELSSFAGDVELSDERLEPFWTRAEELDAVVFLHPFGCSLDERLDRFYLSNTVGQPVENAVALSHLIFSGVLDRHPEPAARRGARRRVPAHVPRSFRPRVAGAARGARMPRAALVVPAASALRLARAHPWRAPRPRGRRGCGPGAARLGLPVRHGRRRPRRTGARCRTLARQTNTRS